MLIKIKKKLLYICLTFVFSNEFTPIQNANLNYIHSRLTWPQIPQASHYELIINDSISFIQFDVNKNSHILTDFLNWGGQYSWSVCGYDQNNLVIECFNNNFFSISELPDYYPDNVNLVYLDDGYHQGLNLLDFDGLGFSVILDKFGNPIWFVDKNNFNPPKILTTQLLKSGNLIGFGAGNGYEINIDGEILFQTPNEFGVHHDFKKHENSYFLLDGLIESHPCPEPCPNNLPEDINWLGDRFIQISNYGELIWEWNSFDYIDLNDFNPLYLERLSINYSEDDTMDWTHSNSIFYNNGKVYISVRNLSRILKIDYESKNLDWHIGEEDFMNQIYFNNSIEFSQQHSVKELSNGNILFFDNHTFLDPEISRCTEFTYDEVTDSLHLVWEYVLPNNLFSGSRGECNRLDNGNTLINVGRTGNIIEVNNLDEIVWHLVLENNNLSQSSYRAERINSLYPLAFSFELDALRGSYYDNYFLENHEIITGQVYNNGTSIQSYNYQLLDSENQIIFNDSLIIDGQSTGHININLNQLDVDTSSDYHIKIIPLSDINQYQEINFKFNQILGDLNSDSIVNVMDAIILVNLILNFEYQSNADYNNDGLLNVLDIISIINSIID